MVSRLATFNYITKKVIDFIFIFTRISLGGNTENHYNNKCFHHFMD